MKKVILGLMLVMGLSAFGREKYRIEVQKIEGVVKYTPQVKKNVPDFYIKHWVNLSNQPLSSENEAHNYIMEARTAESMSIRNNKSTYIYIK